MITLTATSLSLAFGAKELFGGVSFSLEHNDRLGLIGPNGCGKSSLLSILMGETEPTSGGVYIASGTTRGILTQAAAFDIDPNAGRTALEQMYTAFPELLAYEARLNELEGWLSRHENEAGGDKHDSITREYSTLHERYVNEDGLVFRSRCRSILTKMGFDEDSLALDIDALSGGQRTRLALSRQLCREPDILMLDEPTNHLDTETLAWLENYLSSYKKCLIVVSHDRFFLDRVTNKTLLIEHRGAKLYKGGYTASAEQRRIDREVYIHQYKVQQKEIARQEAYIAQQRQWNRERNIIAAESREKLLAKTERLEAPKNDERTVRMRFTPELPSGNDVLEARDVHFRYAGASAELISGVSFKIKRGQRVFIVGPNGCGKSTLIKLLLGRLTPTAGRIDLGHHVEVGYYDQQNQDLNEKNTVLEELWSVHPEMKESEVRGALALFLFYGEDVFKEISVLSGGERARLTLVKLMLSHMNTLILDEPTNHLDIGSREALEEAVGAFDGTVICVSHDRYLVSKLATRVLGFMPDGRLIDMPVTREGDAFSEWEAERDRRMSGGTDASRAKAAPVSSNKEQYLTKKREAAEARREAARIERLRREMHELEEEIDRINAELQGSAGSDYIRAGELTARLEEAENRLLEIYGEVD